MTRYLERITYTWKAGVSLFLIIGILTLLFMLFLDSLYIVSSHISYSYSYAIIVLDIICIIAVIFSVIIDD